MPQVPVEMSVAEVEKMFHVRVIDAPSAQLSVAEVSEQTRRPWWARRLRFRWRDHLALLTLPSPPGT